MLAKKTFFSFLRLTDPTQHGIFNEYHQLDHRPANLALPGVVWGDRWVRTPDCAAADTAHGALDGIHYVAMYWFADPVDKSVLEWRELGERAFQWGRRPDTDWADRQVGFFVPLKGYVSPRVLINEDALPFRPVRGMHVTVSLMNDPHTAATEEAYAWYDRVHIPDLLTCRGVAGAWTFYSEWTTLAAGTTPGAARVTLLYLDEAPAEFLADRRERMGTWDMLDTSAVETKILDSPLEPIEAWKWDWFDDALHRP